MKVTRFVNNDCYTDRLSSKFFFVIEDNNNEKIVICVPFGTIDFRELRGLQAKVS